VRESSTPFPRFTWVECECGCGWEGEDPVTQLVIEEAIMLRLRAEEANERSKANEEQEREERLLEIAGRQGRR
jgi:hypothetical protein